ncbi:ethanolamine ammonia-lyase subunit EutC [Roseomonas indoligenes]|uniref:Ethanolamine ammonia-lyase small subunit n=1 Tax=Roseomonas indoligenes TaxID=2820811 RepID=A0A940N5N9_9PROT|nr:ethanolamine ammonia-lyase subunit EutC [Pararoseomonas indoligenes]MBP0494617.1 ethanolamine ammonia-lyase subunit EutC [Pararoseomonas indoligenes]
MAELPAPDPRSDPWARLRQATRARIGLGGCGDALPLREVLAFQMAHALARDAVHAPLDVAALEAVLHPYAALRARSRAADRGTYLRRPDLGRRLEAMDAAEGPFDAAFVLADGLSATAVQRHAAAVFHAALRRLPGWRIAPPVIATGARVALGDEIGARLGARLVAVLIGERPGLSVPDSLGVYLTFDPRPGRRDSERNCISNIHTAGGLAPELAAAKLAWLMREALSRKLTGNGLKDDADPAALAAPTFALPDG